MYTKQEGMMQMTFAKLPKTITAEELLSTPLPPVKWIVPGLLPAGLALFAGPSKAGKSWLTLWLCLQVAQGKPMWGREIEPQAVLYLSLEDTLNRLQDRLFRLMGSEDTPEKLILQTECQSIGQGLEEQIVDFVHNYPDTGLVVIGTLQKVRSCDQSGSMYASDYRDISALKSLADKYGICILLIHHLRSGSDGMVYLSKEMCLLLKAWRKEREWDRAQRANETVDEDDYLFRQPNGKPMNPCTFTYRFKLILKANNLPLDLNVHSLRHTNASLLIAQGVDVRTVASLGAGKVGKGDWIMRKIKLTRANKSILLKALGDYYYRQRAMNTGWRETGYSILKVDSLPVGKKAVFTSDEVCLARNAVNQLRNKKIKQGQYTDATDDMLLKLN